MVKSIHFLFLCTLFWSSQSTYCQIDTLFISFDYGSDKVPLKAEAISFNQYHLIHLHAYSSGPASAEYNLELSRKRALNMQSFIKKQSPETNIQISYFGDIHNPNEDDNPAHRGVKLMATYWPKPVEKTMPKPTSTKSTTIEVKDIVSQKLILGYTKSGNKFSAEGYADTLVDIPLNENFTVYMTPKNIRKFMRMEELLFYPQSAILTPESERTFNLYLEQIKEQKEQCFEIYGHVNAPFQLAINQSQKELQSLSEARAETIKKLMIKNGFHKSKIKTQGFSNTRMIHPYATEESKMKLNRRVEILMIDCP